MAKRCKSMSPSHGFRCEKERGHERYEGIPTHQLGDIVWQETDLGRTFTTVGVLHEARKQGYSPTFTAFDELAGRSTSAAHELAEWWRATSEAEIEQTVEKAVEYGATDLIDIGLMLARTMGRVVSEEEAAELGVFFYLIGKIARWQSAIERGDRPSDDTLLDIGVYVRMAQRIRQSGGWPGTKEGVK